jgi:hypothetical protein
VPDDEASNNQALSIINQSLADQKSESSEDMEQKIELIIYTAGRFGIKET